MSKFLHARFAWAVLGAGLLANAGALAEMGGTALVPARDDASSPAASAAASYSPLPAPVPVNSADTLDENRKLTIGDRLSYRVIEDKRPAVSLMVTDSGEVDIPLLGRVAAAGKTCRELTASVKEPLEKTYFIKATVIISLDAATLRSPGRIYVIGMVGGPGPQEIPADETYTLSKAITRAGGISQFGNIHHVKIVRKDHDGATKHLEVDLGEIIYKGRIEKDPTLLPNDMVVVPRKLINF